MDSITVTTIINNINSLYGNLVSYTVGLILFAGAFVPAVITFFQRRQFSRDHEELTKRIKIEIQDKVIEAEVNMKSRMEADKKQMLEQLQAENKILEIALRKEIKLMKGAAFHLQAQQLSSFPLETLDSCVHALSLYLEGNDERNARAIIHITKDTIGKLDSSHFDTTLETDPNHCVTSIVKTLRKYDRNGRYSHDINEINSLFKGVQKAHQKGHDINTSAYDKATATP